MSLGESAVRWRECRCLAEPSRALPNRFIVRRSVDEHQAADVTGRWLMTALATRSGAVIWAACAWPGSGTTVLLRQGVVDGGDDGLLAGGAALAEQQHGGVSMFRYGAGSNSRPATVRSSRLIVGTVARRACQLGWRRMAATSSADMPTARAVEVLERGVVLSGGDEVVDPVQDLRLGGQDGAVTGFVEEQLLDVAGEQRRAEGADRAVGVTVEGHCPAVGSPRPWSTTAATSAYSRPMS